MGRLTIYLDDAVENKIKRAARVRRMSVSRWLAQIVEENITSEWPQDIIKLAGSWKDDDFPTLEEIRSDSGLDAERENF